MSENPIESLFDGIEFAQARFSADRRMHIAGWTPPKLTRIDRVRRKIRRVRYETRDRLQHAWAALKGERCDW